MHGHPTGRPLPPASHYGVTMQPIPRHWAIASRHFTGPDGREYDLHINGSSHESESEALRDAQQRLERLIAAGGPYSWTGARNEYYPGRRQREELLEELHSADGALIAAVTRTRYGAAVLNTDALLISDIDLPALPLVPFRSAAPRLLNRLLGRAPRESQVDPEELGLPGLGARAEIHAELRAVIAGFIARHPELGVRTYRTRNGFRLLVTGSGAGPASERAQELMQEVRTDRLYMRLCRVHDTYRARLTPKPWRIDVDRFESLGTRTATAPEHQDWVRRYRDASAQVAVCRLLEVTGPAPSAEEQRIIDLHDRATRPESGLPLA